MSLSHRGHPPKNHTSGWTTSKGAPQAQQGANERRLKKVCKEIDALIDSFAEGIRSASMKARLEALENEKAELEGEGRAPAPTPLRLHPKLPELYRAKVDNLARSLSDPEIRDEAVELLRSLIESVRVTPADKIWEVEIKGEIGRMTNLAQGKTEQNQCSVKVVAGAYNPRQYDLPPILI